MRKIDTIDDAFRGAAGTIEQLVRAIVRGEVRKHLGPEAEHLLSVGDAPMTARKLRALIKIGELRGFKHGRDTFISASEFRAFVEGRPVAAAPRIVVAEPDPDASHDVSDELSVAFGVEPADPAERRAFEVRLARRRLEGGERAEKLRQVEERKLLSEQKEERLRIRKAERVAKLPSK